MPVIKHRDDLLPKCHQVITQKHCILLIVTLQHTETEYLFSMASEEETLQYLTMDDLVHLWRQILHQFSLREEVVNELGTTLHQVEDDRVVMV